MKKMRTLVVILSMGIGATKTISQTPAHAGQNIKTQSRSSVEREMVRNLTDVQKEELLAILSVAMRIFRDDRPLNPDASRFGDLQEVESRPDEYWKLYTYQPISIPIATIQIETIPDPLNFADGRASVPAVPHSLNLYFFSMVNGIDRRELENLLSLENFWIDASGGRHDGNSLPSFPPLLRQHVYRYRAKEQVTSRFPVDVEFFYFEPKDGDENRKPRLDAIKITRSYSYVTPEMRKKMREEEQQKTRK
jgi:hypothetical protein